MPVVTWFFNVSAADLGESVFYSQVFFTLHSFQFFQGFPGAGSSTSKLAGLHAELLFKSQQSTKDLYVVGLRARAGQSQNTNRHRELVLWNISFEIFAPYEI